ncbi:MAG: alpha/beta hydrolase [Solirubrobacterales bacterium]
MSDLDLLVHEIRPASGEPRGALVLHHGRGTDRHDLLPLVDALDPERALVGVTPQAPLQLPPGGWHWYMVPRVGYPDPASFWESFSLLERFHDALPEALGVGWERTIVGGFSMGAVMSYALGLSKSRPAPAGIVALSGFIPTVDGYEPHLDDRSDLPVAIGHGSEDPVIGVEFARRDKQALEGAGLPVLYREAPMGHTIDPAFIPLLQDWIADRLGG